jgi:hypothetical protein
MNVDTAAIEEAIAAFDIGVLPGRKSTKNCSFGFSLAFSKDAYRQPDNIVVPIMLLELLGVVVAEATVE